MIKLKLVKALSYRGAVRATVKEPYATVETEAEANALVATGYFEVVGGADKAAPNTEPEDGELEKLTVEKLKALAAEKGVDTSKCTKKAEYIAAITAADEQSDSADFGDDEQ